MDEDVYNGLRKGDVHAIFELAMAIENRNLTQSEIQNAWFSIVEGVLRDPQGQNSDALINISMDLADVKQNPTMGKMFEDLMITVSFPNGQRTSGAVIGIGAAIARMGKGRYPKALDRGRYLTLAKSVLLHAMNHAHHESRVHAAEVLRNIPDDEEVKGELVKVARKPPTKEMEKAVGGSLRHIRTTGEIQAIAIDRIRVERRYEEWDPRRTCLEGILLAAEKVFTARPADGLEYSVSVKQLASATHAVSTNLGELFTGKMDRELVEDVMLRVEDALLHVMFNAQKPEKRVEAAHGLTRIASDRVEQILEKIVGRKGERELTNGGRLAAETLAQIRGRKVEILDLKPANAKPPRVPWQVRPKGSTARAGQ